MRDEGTRRDLAGVLHSQEWLCYTPQLNTAEFILFSRATTPRGMEKPAYRRQAHNRILDRRGLLVKVIND